MEFISTKINGAALIKPDVHVDERGFFLESFKKSVFLAHGIYVDFPQDNHSRSSHGVLRGLHYQLVPHVQAKLVRCVHGEIYDVIVDLRKNSPTFGVWEGFQLSAENKHILYVPEGLAHGFLTLSAHAELLYKTSCEYSPTHDRGIVYNDPTLQIVWPKLDVEYIISGKDSKLLLFNDAEML